MIENQNISNDITVEEKDGGENTVYELSPQDLRATVTMQTTKELQLRADELIQADTCVCCPERAEHWFKLTVHQTADYSFTGNTHARVGARLYDRNGELLASDNIDGESNTFLINYPLLQGLVYYLRITPTYSYFTRFSTIITGTFTPVESISLTQNTLSSPPKHTWQLFSTVSPENATNKYLYWSSSNTNVATVDLNGKIVTKNIGTAVIYARAVDGSSVFAQCTVNVTNDYHYILNKSNDNAVSFKNDLDGALKAYDCRADVCVEPLVKSAKQIWKIEKILNTDNYYIRAYLDEEYGFNIRTTTDNCDLIEIAENETDAKVCFVDQGNGYSKIRLVNYPEYYLTLVSGGNDVKWDNTSQGDRQLWKREIVDWDQYNAERIEYHVLCGGDNTKALRVGTRNVLDISTDLPVRGERLSYWNRQKWTIKGKGNQKQICSQLDNKYVLCNDGTGNAYISDSVTSANSNLTVTPYDVDNDLYEIRLTQSGLYLTLEYNSADSLYWGKWKTYDPDFHEIYQVWKLVEQPDENSLGVDSYTPVSATTAKILAKNKKVFSMRYYTSSSTSGKLLKSDEVLNLHNAGLKIVSVYQDYGKSISEFSETAAIEDATKALELATAVGQPTGSVIYFAVDYDPAYSEREVIKKYFETLKAKIGGKYEIGVYGTASICNLIKSDGSIKFSWLAQSTGAYSSVGAGAEGDADYISYDSLKKYDIKQTETIYYNNVEFDSDTAITSNYGQW